MDKPVVIFGAKGIVHTVLDACVEAGRIVYCLLDEDESLHNTEIGDISVMGAFDHEPVLGILGKECGAFVALEDKSERQELIDALVKKHKSMPVNIIHPKASVSANAWIGHGNLIAANACLEGSAKISNHTMIMPNATIGHGSEIGDYAMIGAGCTIGHGVTVADGAHIGQNATITPGVSIGEGAQVGHGSVVLTDVEKGAIVFGVPAKAL